MTDDNQSMVPIYEAFTHHIHMVDGAGKRPDLGPTSMSGLANVHGALCVVELKLRWLSEDEKEERIPA